MLARGNFIGTTSRMPESPSLLASAAQQPHSRAGACAGRYHAQAQARRRHTIIQLSRLQEAYAPGLSGRSM